MTMEIRFPLILDGATGTELQKRGYGGDVSAEQWTLEHPDVIVDIQRGYVAAGSQVLYTPTFGANRQKLEERSIFNQTADYNRRLAALSREAAGGKAWIAGDLAPTGLFLAPLGEASFEDLVNIYTEQAAGLEAAGVDLYVIETMMTLSDARAAVLAVRSVSDKPIFVSFTCDERGRSLSGTDVTAALTVLQGMGISAFGLNCSTGPEQMLVQLRRLREYARVPLIAKPNAGMPITVGGKTVYDCTPEEFTAFVQPMLENIIRKSSTGRRGRFRRLLRHDGGAYCRAARGPQGREIRPARAGAHGSAPGRDREASLLPADGRRARSGADRRAGSRGPAGGCARRQRAHGRAACCRLGGHRRADRRTVPAEQAAVPRLRRCRAARGRATRLSGPRAVRGRAPGGSAAAPVRPVWPVDLNSRRPRW